MSYQATISRAFQRYGQDVTVTNNGNQYTVRALLTMMGGGDQANFFDGNEAVGLVKPALLMYIPGDDPNGGNIENGLFSSDIFGDGMTRPQQSGFTVRKIERVRIGGVVVVYICACD